MITEAIPPVFGRELATALIQNAIYRPWYSFAMVHDLFDAKLFELLKKSGCHHLVIGLETMCTRVLKLMKKHATREKNLRFLREAKKAEMHLVVNLIPNLPTTTYEEAVSTLEDLNEFRDWLYRVSVFPFEPTKSSNVGKSPEGFGLIETKKEGVRAQSQFPENHFGSLDPAMSEVEHKSVLKMYRDVANDVNSKDRHATIKPIESTSHRVKAESLHIRHSGDSSYVFNWVTRRGFKTTRRIGFWIDALAEIKNLDTIGLRSMIGESVCKGLLCELGECQLIESVLELGGNTECDLSYSEFGASVTH